MGRYTLRQCIEHDIPPYRLLGNRVVLEKKARRKDRQACRQQAGR